MFICMLCIAKEYGMILSASMAVYVTGDWERIKICSLSCASWVNTEGKPYNGDEDGITVIADENLCVWSTEPTKKTHHQLTVFLMSSYELDPPLTSAPSQSSGTPTYTMATVINLPTFPEFELQPRDTAPTRFEKYVKRLNNTLSVWLWWSKREASTDRDKCQSVPVYVQ